jgi:CHAT domain-containing protein
MISGLDLAFSILQASPSRPAPEARTSVFDALIRSRTLVLDEIAARHRGIRKSENPEVARLDRTLEQARHTYARLLVEGPSPRSPGPYPARLKGARLEMEQAERALAETSRDFIDERRRLDLTREAIVRALPAGTALVSYFVYRRFMEPAPSLPVPSYLAIVLTPHAAAPIIVPLGRADEIEARIDRWWEEASTAPADPAADATYETASQALRQSIWDPVARHLGRATGAFVVPDGAVHAVSLATLVDARGTYLLESGPTFHYLSAERDLLTPAAPAPRGRGLLALGGPDFDAPPKVKPPPAPDAGRSETPPRTPKTDPCSDSAAVRFSPIPGSTMEAEQVRTLWSEHGKGRTTPGPIVLLRGAEATEGNLCRSAPGKHVLHLATHAFYLPSRCEGGRPADLARSTPGRDPREGRLEAGVPLRVSGLALSGANQRGGSSPPPASEDGLLTGEEIVSLDLSDVAWVVLSGCRTGIGLARAGEGIFGLRRSFQIAGARTLILSLWPVGDNEPQAWMMELYRGRAAGGTTADVTRRASQHILAQRRKAKVTTHPFFWGAFVATGDWR